MNATLFATTRLRRYLPKLRLNWPGIKTADQCSSSVSFCKGNLYRHGRPPSRPPGLLFWAELASLLLIVLYGHAEALWPRQSTRQKTPLRMAALALCASWRCAPRSASPRSFSLDIGKVPTGWWAVRQQPVLQRVMREDGEAAGRTLACLYVARRSVTPRWGSVSSSPPRSAPGRPWTLRQTGTKPRWVGRRS